MIGIALVLAAGKGTRMLPNTRSYPKELMEFGEKPVIEHVLTSVKDSGFKKVLLVVGHKKGALIDYIGDGKHFGLSTEYIYQEEPKGLGHAILSSSPHFFLIGFYSLFCNNAPIQSLSLLLQHQIQQ